MNKARITITLSGERGCGKSTVGAQLAKALRDAGFNVEVSPTVPDPARWGGVVDPIRGQNQSVLIQETQNEVRLDYRGNLVIAGSKITRVRG